MWFLLINLCYLRYITRYEEEYESIREILKEKCTNFFMLSAKNFYDSQFILIPIFYMFFLRIFNLSRKISSLGIKTTKEYYDLTRK